MAHADSLKSVINRFANSVTDPFVVAANQSDAVDQWVAIHLLNDEVELYDSATCSDVTVWKELSSAWKEFFAHVHFNCTGNGAMIKKSFGVSVIPVSLASGNLFYMAITDWSSPNLAIKFKGAIVPFTNDPGEDRVTVQEITPPSKPHDPTNYDYPGNPSIPA